MTGPAASYWVAQAHQRVICDTGFLTDEAVRALNRECRTGGLVKWRGHWRPVAGASFGIGPLKTCYGTPEAKAQLPS